MTAPRTGPEPHPGRSVPDRLLGAVGIGMMLLAVWLLLFGGPSDEATPPPPPSLTLTSPGAGDTVSSPLQIRFTSTASIEPLPGGWGVSGYHLHANIEETEIMPGPGDIRREGEGYVWVVPAVPAGAMDLGLSWSDANHSPVLEGSTPPVSIVVR